MTPLSKHNVLWVGPAAATVRRSRARHQQPRHYATSALALSEETGGTAF